MHIPRKTTMFLMILFVIAWKPVFSQSVHSNLKSDELLKRFNHISEEVLCVCGCNQPLGYCNHMNCIAWGIRGVIDNLLLAGKSDEYIIAGFINGYGDMVDNDAAFQIIREQYQNYLEKFRKGFGEQYRSYPSKHNPEIIIVILFLLFAGIAGLFLKGKLRGLKKSSQPAKVKTSSDPQKDQLYKDLYK